MVFTIYTGENVNYLAMYAEKGQHIKTWRASEFSEMEGERRKWTLDYEFSMAGTRQMTFKASVDGTIYSEGETVSIEVPEPPEPEPEVEPDITTPAQKAVTFTLETEPAAEYVRMFNEEGAVIKTWTADEDTVLVGEIRGWVLKFAFAMPGLRTVVFRASQDGENFGSGTELRVRVTPNVASAKVAANIVEAKREQIFEVKTGTSSTYLTMFNEKGGVVKTWTEAGNTKDAGGLRTWTLKYAFGVPGDRKITFRSSMDGKNYGNGQSVSFRVVSANAR